MFFLLSIDHMIHGHSFGPLAGLSSLCGHAFSPQWLLGFSLIYYFPLYGCQIVIFFDAVAMLHVAKLSLSCISYTRGFPFQVCRYCQQQPEKSICFVCQTSENLWMCVICGFVGCGRYWTFILEMYCNYSSTTTFHAFSDMEIYSIYQIANDCYKLWCYAVEYFLCC